MRSDLKTRRKELKETLSDLSRRLAAANGSSDDAEVRCAAPDVAQMRAAEVEVASRCGGWTTDPMVCAPRAGARSRARVWMPCRLPPIAGIACRKHHDRRRCA